jgi:hypothetical protein
MNFQDEIYEKQKDEEDAIITALGKYVGYSVRMAGVLEVMKNNGKRPKEISHETMKNSIEIMRYFESHFRYLFNMSRESDVEQIISAFKTGVVEDETSVRDLYRHHQKLFGKNANETMLTLERLADRNILTVRKQGKSNFIKINPELYST